MSRVLILFSDENERLYIRRLLASEGVNAQSEYSSGAQALRRVRQMGSGVIVCGWRLCDMTAADLAYSLSDEPNVGVAIVASPEQLSYCAAQNVYALPLPLDRRELIDAVRALQRLGYADARSRRSDAEDEAIVRAKKLLSARCGLSESDAHRFIQKKSMDGGMKMADAARRIVCALQKQEDGARKGNARP